MCVWEEEGGGGNQAATQQKRINEGKEIKIAEAVAAAAAAHSPSLYPPRMRDDKNVLDGCEGVRG